jgi:hypothetical protein
MADQMTDGDLTEIAERHATRIYGHHVRAEWAYYEIPALIAEVRRLRGEHAAMLDVIEAAEMAVSPKLMGSAHQEAGRDAGYCDACLRPWPCEGAALSDALARFYDLIGDDL